MSWGMVVAAGASLIGGAMQSRAGERGADAQANAAQSATDEQRRQFDLTRQDLAPWMESGGWALDQQRNFLEGDWSGFQNSPDYLWAVQQGTQQLDNGATAQGNLWGGGADADRIALGQGLATQYAGNYYNRLAGLSQTGQQTANQLGQFGAQFGQQAGQNMQTGAAARASSYANSANAWGNALGQGASLFGEWQGYGGGTKPIGRVDPYKG